MNRWRASLGRFVYPPAPYPWLPPPTSPVDEATLRRVIAGLERLGAQHHTPQAAEEHPATAEQATVPRTHRVASKPLPARPHTGAPRATRPQPIERTEHARMTRITYFHRTTPLTDLDPALEADALPPDEPTAAVTLAALLTRDHGTRWPGEYGAVVDPENGARPSVVTEDDPRVMIARGMLLAMAHQGPYRADELAVVRRALLSHGMPRHACCSSPLSSPRTPPATQA